MRARAAAVCITLVIGALLTSCTRSVAESPYLMILAGDEDEADSDFLAVIDVAPGSPTFGKAIATTPIGMKGSMPHHMDTRCRRPVSCCS
jgi:hypothetical protein